MILGSNPRSNKNEIYWFFYIYIFKNSKIKLKKMPKNSHKHFDVEYDMSQMIKISHKHFDMEYDMKINTNFMIQFIVCNVSYKNKN
jgi:hypothetical protein